MRVFLGLIAILLIGGICFSVNPAENDYTKGNEELPLPVVPTSLRESGERAAFILEHFWDSLDFRNDPRLQNKVLMEQSFVNFLSVFPYADSVAQRCAVDNLLNRAQINKDAFKQVIKLAETYLYNSDSPMVDEGLYIMFLENMVKSPALDDVEKLRPVAHLEMALKNRPGNHASDFEFETLSGSHTSLSDITVSGDLLLIFYDPDCAHCNEVMKSLAQNTILQNKEKEGEITILAVYSGDDKELWKRHAKSLPTDWILGFEDGTIQDDGVYVIRSLPTLFLLDSEKKVLLKEPRPETLFK